MIKFGLGPPSSPALGSRHLTARPDFYFAPNRAGASERFCPPELVRSSRAHRRTGRRESPARKSGNATS